MIWVGTSGYSYPEWKGSFYPPGLAAAEMLPFYAARFSTVEINNTFYRMPSEKVLAGWAASTPARFKLTLKAPRRITHDAGLRHCRETVEAFCEVAATLGPKLGVLLFQLPPSMRKDAALLQDFLPALRPGTRAAFEFRHPSWHDDEVFEQLREHNLALCIADSEKMTTPVVETADYGYFRLRDEGYTAADLARWAGAIQQRLDRWRDTFVYFKHEEQGKGPELAKTLCEMLGGDARRVTGVASAPATGRMTLPRPRRKPWPAVRSERAIDRSGCAPAGAAANEPDVSVFCEPCGRIVSWEPR
ncbi:MAG: DUF72 domain-containing protein [Acidobacteria bacterium]|nr:DUF72 domain-containing protein [Acidobacteriota bacterium]